MRHFPSVAKEVKLNARAWWGIRTTLSRHSRCLKAYSSPCDTSPQIQEYTKVLKDVLALWARTVDPSITLPYDALSSYDKTSQFFENRQDLFLLTQEYGIGQTDEDAIYEQKNRLEEAFKAIIDSGGSTISKSSQPPKGRRYKDYPRRANSSDGNKIGTSIASSLDAESSICRKRIRSDSEGDHEVDGQTSKRRKTATDATTDTKVAVEGGT